MAQHTGKEALMNTGNNKGAGSRGVPVQYSPELLVGSEVWLGELQDTE